MNKNVIFLTKQLKMLSINRRLFAQLAPSINTTVKSYEEVPGPKSLPLLGNCLIFLPMIVGYSNFTDILKNMHKSYGKIACLRNLIFQKDIVVLTDADEIEKVFRLQEPMPYRGVILSLQDYRLKHRADLYAENPGLTVSGGPKWQEARRLANQTFMKPGVAKKYVQKIDDISKEMVERIHTIRDEKNELPEDFSLELNKWALEDIMMICLDKRMGCISSENAKTSKDALALITATHDIFKNLVSLDLSISLHRYVPTPTWRKFTRDMDLINRLVSKYIKDARNATQIQQTEETDKSILERIMDKTDNENLICALIVDMIVGGVETSGYAAATLLYYLAVNEDKQANLYEEIKKVLPTNESEPLTADHLNQMKYLKACLQESFRLTPTAYANARDLKEDTVLCNYLIPKGTTIVTNQFVLTRTEEYFYEPHKFIPERWIKGHPSYHQNFHPFALLPFGFGVRRCVGKTFAEIELSTLIARIIRSFHVEYHYDMVFTADTLIRPTSPLKFKLTKRK